MQATKTGVADVAAAGENHTAAPVDAFDAAIGSALDSAAEQGGGPADDVSAPEPGVEGTEVFDDPSLDETDSSADDGGGLT